MCITSDVSYYGIKTFLLFMQSNVYTPNPLMVPYLLQLFQILNDIQLNVTETSTKQLQWSLELLSKLHFMECNLKRVYFLNFFKIKNGVLKNDTL